MSPKQQFIDTYARESATTLNVLHAFPTAKSDLKPRPVCRSARALAWIFVTERVANGCAVRSV